MKTETNFNRNNIIRGRRLKTIGSQLYSFKQSYRNEQFKRQIQSVLSQADRYDQYQNVKKQYSQQKYSGIGNQLFHKTPKRLQRYDQQNQNLTQQFIAQWSRMDTTKRQTYQRLRNKLVQKYPTFRQKYKKGQVGQIQQPSPTKINNKKIQFQRSSRVQSLHQSIRKINDKNQYPSKGVCFYSRSAKKCLTSNYPEPQQVQEQKQVGISRLNYLKYMKNHSQHKYLQIKKIKGQNMIKTRQSILSLQKQGTKSYISLKKSLEDAIETCIRYQ